MDSIKDMKCPECGRNEKFEIEIGTTLVIYNSDDEFSWKAGSDCACGNERCDFQGTVADFLAADAQTATEPAQHTPTPWHWHEATRYIFALDGTTHDQVAEIEAGSRSDAEAKANARHIVLAVNCHDDLLTACKDLLDGFFDMSPLEYAQSRGLEYMSDAEGDKIKERARAAIAKAEAKPSC